MKKITKKISLLLAGCLLVGSVLTACGGSKDKAPSGTLVLGALEFNGIFSPFFSHSATDQDVWLKVCEPLISNDRTAEPTDGVCKYKVPEVVEKDGKTQTIYTFQIKDDVKFSDGSEPTADDIIFALKVLCDPSYDGSSSTYTLPIVGVNEYRYDDPNYAAALAEIDSMVEAFDPAQASEDVVKAAAQSLVDDYGIELSQAMPGGEFYESDTVGLLPTFYRKSLEKAYIDKNMAEGGNKVPDIAGVEKVDDKTVKITLDGVDPTAIWNLGGIYLVPAKHYGGEFEKGDLSKVKAKNGEPMGTGPFAFKSFENNVVTLEANTNYYKGTPKIGKIKFQIVDESTKLENVKLGNCDISDPTASKEMVAKVEEAGMHMSLIENLGYGYIGINAERVEKEVRKGLMCLMNREPAIEAYYGDLASVIERPMSKVSWAYPEDAKPYYTYSKDEALEHFTKAGYTQEGGKLVKDGKQLSVEIYVGDLATHPSGPIITQMKADLESLGGELVIQDVAQDVLFDKMDTRTADMWVAAWQATIDPDMYQLYNSKSADNPYRIKNEELDQLMMDARKTLDIEERKPLYHKALDIIMDEAIEMPVYQRKNMVIFNPENIDVESIVKDQTPFYKWDMELEKLQMAK